jgi:putative oxidoreductase
MWNTLDRYRDGALLLLRLGVGLGFFWYHGWPKLSGGPERWAGVGGAMESLGLGFAPVAFGFLAALAESLGGLLFAFGLFTRPAILALAAVMFVATINHWVTGQGTPAHSFKNFFFLIGLVAIGPGRHSVDHWLTRRRSDP